MANKSHLYFQNPVEGVVQYVQKARIVKREDDGLPKYYEGMKDAFRRFMGQFDNDRAERLRSRNQALDIPKHINYIKLTFFGSFDSEKFVPRYRQNFGLVPIKFELFNTEGLFAIENEEQFKTFFSELQIFIATDRHTGTLAYNVDVRYIKEFTLLTNQEIIAYENYFGVALLNLVDSEEIFTEYILPIEKSLEIYLLKSKIKHEINYENRTIQIWDITEGEIQNIIGNFDIIHSVSSSLTGVIGPGAYNTPIRDFGFILMPPEDNAETIGILDTGIANIQALQTLILNSNAEYDLKGSGSLVDKYDRGYGHGTGVAGLATFGSRHIPDHRGNKRADAWLISIKIFEENTARSSDKAIIELIRKVHEEKEVRIYVLTVTESISKKKNETFSAFAYAVDKLAHELDILIFISSGNIGHEHFFDANDRSIHRYPLDFIHDYTNIKSPSESMNNITIGACAGNFENGINSGIAVDKNFPAIYSSKFHYDFSNGVLSNKQTNKHLKKPDVIYYGGDIDGSLLTSDPGIKHFSAKTGIFYDKSPGTSYSAPLVANMGIRILNEYPDLRTQTVKALIINSSEPPALGNNFNGLPSHIIGNIIGHGIPQPDECIYSDNNSVTIILEDEISPDRLKAFDIKIPEYLLRKENKSPVLDVKATLCFSFEPALNNQMAYCPVHIGFGIFKNFPLDKKQTIINDDGEEDVEYLGINGNSSKALSIKAGYSWSEDYYFKRKLLSNTQKKEWSYKKENISANGNVFKLAINCKRHKLLSPAQLVKYNIPHKFSLVMNFKERPHKTRLSGSLYNELEAINVLRTISILEAESDASAIAEAE